MNERTARHIAALAVLLLALGGTVREAGAQSAILSQDQAVRTAIAESPSLRGAGLEVESAAWGVTGEEGRFPLTLVLDGGYTHAASLSPDPVEGASTVRFGDTIDTGAELRKHLRMGTDLSLRVEGSWQTSEGVSAVGDELALGPYWGLGVRLAAIQPLLRGAGDDVGEAALRVAEAQRSSAELTRERAASELVREVIVAYWELWYASRSVAIEREALVLAERQQKDAQGLADSGSRAPADVLSFETRVATRQEAVLNAEVAELQRATALSQLLGRPPTPLRAAEAAPAAGDAPAEATLRAALARSPEIRESEAAVTVARAQAQSAGDANRPRLDLDAYVDARGLSTETVAPAFGQVGALDALSGHVGLTLELPLDDSARRADVARANLAVQAAEARLEAARRQVEASLETQLTTAAAARRRIELALATVAVAEKQVEAESARYAAGASTPLTVLEAQDSLRAAKLRVTRARVDAVLASTQLAHLAGALLDREGLRLPSARASRGAGAARVRAVF